MSKKSKKNKKAKRSRKPVAKTVRGVAKQSRGFREAGEAILGATLGPSVDLQVTWDHFEHVMNYELWLALKDEDTAPLPPGDDELPSWYVAAARHSSEAFEFVRHQSFLYLASALRQTPSAEILISLFRRATALDSAGSAALQTTLDDAYGRFLRQYREAMASMRAVAEVSGPTGQLRMALYAWAAIYETDAPVWFLGVLGKALRTGRVDSGSFGGPATSTHQGSLLDAVAQQLEGTPLRSIIEGAFDKNLRNSLAHNDVEIQTSSAGITIRDGLTARTWTGQEAWELIDAGQQLLQSILVAVQVARVSRDTSALKLSGVMSVTYSLTEAGIPLIALGQLWCCRDLDPDGSWLDSTTLTLRRSKSTDELLAGSTAMAGGSSLHEDLVHRMETSGWVWVNRVSVAPDLGRGLPKLVNVEGESLEVIGSSDRHLVPIKVER